MDKEELKDRLEILKEKLKTTEIKQKIFQIEQESAQPSFWQEPQEATKKMKELAFLQDELNELDEIELWLKEDKLTEVQKRLDKLETRIYLSGKYDRSDAILSINAGAGGVEAMDWAEILQRMYLRYAEKKGWDVDIVDIAPGEEAGVKSVTLMISGPYAYGYLKGEVGVHRLVRQSPFNADHLRQTSFALVEVLPKIDENTEVKVNPDDLEWDFFRASSHGGQNVQKVSTAVRIRHKPTGMIVTSQSQRYQEQNRKIALSLLQAKLWALSESQAKEEKQKIKGEHKMASWGNQIRSYVLHPYRMVKDLRTEVETSDTENVLNGDLDSFVDAELKFLVR